MVRVPRSNTASELFSCNVTNARVESGDTAMNSGSKSRLGKRPGKMRTPCAQLVFATVKRGEINLRADCLVEPVGTRFLIRHSGESRNPECAGVTRFDLLPDWVPAFAGMTRRGSFAAVTRFLIRHSGESRNPECAGVTRFDLLPDWIPASAGMTR